jgi:hypothetical protein
MKNISRVSVQISSALRCRDRICLGFRSMLLLLAFAVLPGYSSAAVYRLSAPSYSGTGDFTPPCTPTVGNCANFTTAMRAEGSFTTPTPLAPNLNDADLVSVMSSFSFFDGISTYASSSANTRVLHANASTNAAGQVIAFSLSLQLWRRAAPHVAGDRFDSIFWRDTAIASGHNNICDTVSPQDSCVVSLTVTQEESVATSGGGTFALQGSTVAPVPSLSELGLAMLAALLCAGAAFQMLKRRLPGRF